MHSLPVISEFQAPIGQAPAGDDRSAVNYKRPVEMDITGWQSPGHTLQTTALIHEVYLKLAGGSEKKWRDRAHFFGVADLLVDHGRAKGAAKRGGNVQVIRFEEGLSIEERLGDEIIALDNALNTLAKLNPRQSEVVELRYFAGLSVEEAAAVLNVSPETVMRDWRVAKAYLYREMKAGPPDPHASQSPSS